MWLVANVNVNRRVATVHSALANMHVAVHSKLHPNIMQLRIVYDPQTYGPG